MANIKAKSLSDGTNTVYFMDELINSGNGKVTLRSSLNHDMSSTINISGSAYVPITYNELCTLLDNEELIPGTMYRITDYVTKTTQRLTASADNKFDILVMATSNKSLSSNAKAIWSDRDSYYFYGSHLDQWEIKYDIRNDKTKYAWADTDNGTGVIYYMKDEWGNEAPYDFKNILFAYYRASSCSLNNFITGTSNTSAYSSMNATYGNSVLNNIVGKACIHPDIDRPSTNNSYKYDVPALDVNDSERPERFSYNGITYSTDVIYKYTFTRTDTSNYTITSIKDATMSGNKAAGNTIKPYFNGTKRWLNAITLEIQNSNDYISNNHIGDNCKNIVMIGSLDDITIGNNCSHIYSFNTYYYNIKDRCANIFILGDTGGTTICENCNTIFITGDDAWDCYISPRCRNICEICSNAYIEYGAYNELWYDNNQIIIN